ncbi:MAG: hypothetical protein AABN34_25515 [Acidobacteriota bacterium]
MSAQPKFHVAAWLAGSLFALLAVNFLLILFVSGTDILLGQPPQVMVPLFALLVAATALVAVRRTKARATEVFASEVSERKSRRNGATTTPAYVAMTIIRRPYVAAALAPDEWRGAIQ